MSRSFRVPQMDRFIEIEQQSAELQKLIERCEAIEQALLGDEDDIQDILAHAKVILELMRRSDFDSLHAAEIVYARVVALANQCIQIERDEGDQYIHYLNECDTQGREPEDPLVWTSDYYDEHRAAFDHLSHELTVFQWATLSLYLSLVKKELHSDKLAMAEVIRYGVPHRFLVSRGDTRLSVFVTFPVSLRTDRKALCYWRTNFGGKATGCVVARTVTGGITYETEEYVFPNLKCAYGFVEHTEKMLAQWDRYVGDFLIEVSGVKCLATKGKIGQGIKTVADAAVT